MAEWWYNTSFHTALKVTPFQALYGFPPPQVAYMFLIDDNTETAAEMLQNRQVANQIIKRNLQEAQNRMVHFANRNRSDRELLVGDMVYLKVQPYRHSSLSIHHCIKLHSKFYGPFRVLAKVGQTSYRLLLPEGCKLHSTFHVSQLKKHKGPLAIPAPALPLIDDEGNIQLGPEAVLQRKLIPRKQGTISIPVVQWLVKWINLPESSATWEDASFIQKVFPEFTP
jgi:translation initiation factor IF-1